MIYAVGDDVRIEVGPRAGHVGRIIGRAGDSEFCRVRFADGGTQQFSIAEFQPARIEQPMPVVNGHPAVWDLVLRDIDHRDKVGAAKYRTRLQPHNGRDFLRDAYEEALDLVVYLRGAIFERDGK